MDDAPPADRRGARRRSLVARWLAPPARPPLEAEGELPLLLLEAGRDPEHRWLDRHPLDLAELDRPHLPLDRAGRGVVVLLVGELGGDHDLERHAAEKLPPRLVGAAHEGVVVL